MSAKLHVWTAGLAIMTAATCATAWADVESGPPVNEAPPALPVTAVVGEIEGKDVDYVAERGDRPTVYLLIPAERFNRPLARFMKALDEKAGDLNEAGVVAVWLTETAEQTKEYLPRAQQSMQFQRTALTYFPQAAGPDNWGVNDQADCTAVVVRGKKVVARFGFVSVSDTLVPDVVKSLKGE